MKHWLSAESKTTKKKGWGKGEKKEKKTKEKKNKSTKTFYFSLIIVFCYWYFDRRGEKEGGYNIINRFIPVTLQCLSIARNCISNGICHGLFYVQWIDVRGDCLFCRYWWNRWPLMKSLTISFHNNYFSGNFIILLTLSVDDKSAVTKTWSSKVSKIKMRRKNTHNSFYLR